MSESLNEREKTILRSVINTFILSATPVGSRYISRKHSIGLSAATVRNVMSDLEDLGYINHPHTSAGRIPTDKGYRFYIDSLMELEQLSTQEEADIHTQLQGVTTPEDLLRETSKLIGAISHQLGIVALPRISAGVLEKIELVSLSSTRIMVIISIRSGLVKTIMMEVQTEISRSQLEEVARILNERLSGLTLRQIRRTFPARMRDMQSEETGLIRLFVDSVDQLFTEGKGHEKVHIGGAKSLLSQPEFFHSDKFRGIIELLENEDMIVHVLEKNEPKDGAVLVSIGSETKDERMTDLSIVTTNYSFGEVTGALGVIGAKRMNYSKIIPVVDYVAKIISTIFKRSVK